MYSIKDVVGEMGKKILIIDDDADVLDVMKEVLHYEGFEAVTSPVSDGYENMIRENKVDLVIIDYLLMGINGGEICHRIKCCPEFGHLPVILYSAYPKVIHTPGNYGCDAFIPKPFNLADIMGQITKLLHYPSRQIYID